MELNKKIDVSATWELELLISGLVLVALIQVPGILDAFFEPRMPHAVGAGRSALIALQLYTKAAAFALIGAFVLHLVARAYWVGLIGLNSVFPDGPKWEQARYGPIGRKVYQERFRSLPGLIARTDDFCSVTFPFAFLLVVLVGLSIFYFGVFGGLSYLVSRFLLHGRSGTRVVTAVLLVFAFTPPLLIFIDRRMGAKLDPTRGAGLALARAIGVFSTLTGLSLYGPIMFTLFTNVRKKVIYPVFYLAFLGVILLSFGSIMARRGSLQVNAYDFFGRSQAHGLNAQYYETQRPAGKEYAVQPMIQSDMIADPYVRLFVPYSPTRSNEYLAKRCPALRPLVRRGVAMDPGWIADTAAAATLACLADVLGVTVNGMPRPDLDLRFYEHPRLGLRGVVTYIATDAMPRGRNEILLRRIPALKEGGGGYDTASYLIPFWR